MASIGRCGAGRNTWRWCRTGRNIWSWCRIGVGATSSNCAGRAAGSMLASSSESGRLRRAAGTRTARALWRASLATGVTCAVALGRRDPAGSVAPAQVTATPTAARTPRRSRRRASGDLANSVRAGWMNRRGRVCVIGPPGRIVKVGVATEISPAVQGPATTGSHRPGDGKAL